MDMPRKRRAQIIIPAGLCPWPHELRVAKILSLAGHTVEFLPTRTSKTADILLDGIEFEIKSPLTNKPKKILRNLKRASFNLRMSLLTLQELRACVTILFVSFWLIELKTRRP